MDGLPPSNVAKMKDRNARKKRSESSLRSSLSRNLTHAAKYAGKAATQCLVIDQSRFHFMQRPAAADSSTARIDVATKVLLLLIDCRVNSKIRH
jgi:rRNA pseudouridine-1189 N-methylase Emg1 (Nep1/Mra1 family)